MSVSSRAGKATLNSRAPSATLASSTIDLSSAGEAWRTLLASAPDNLIVDGLVVSTS